MGTLTLLEIVRGWGWNQNNPPIIGMSDVQRPVKLLVTRVGLAPGQNVRSVQHFPDVVHAGCAGQIQFSARALPRLLPFIPFFGVGVIAGKSDVNGEGLPFEMHGHWYWLFITEVRLPVGLRLLYRRNRCAGRRRCAGRTRDRRKPSIRPVVGIGFAKQD